MKKTISYLAVVLFLICISKVQSQTKDVVKASVEPMNFPTYLLGPDEVQTMFNEYRIPGDIPFRSRRLVYPYTLQDEFTTNRIDKNYEAVILENKFIKVIVLPELRGRLQAAIDKRNGWDFLYFNHVIKPADISTRQAWISGGLEWNHPQGHGYTQFIKTSYKIIDEDDGAKTVLVAEVEPNRMMKWEMAITLRPGRLFVETTGRFTSLVDYPIPFASSQNAAMHATEETETIYPKGTWITSHGKRNFAKWPVSNGIDYSYLKNIKSGFSVFAEGLGIKEDYYGVFSHDKNAGTVVVADHRTAPGKKFFTWGFSPDGRIWDKLLSDSDGAYLELQLGAYWDNLGYGYSWLNPMEEKKFTAYWYPIKDIDGFVVANNDLALNVKVKDNNQLFIGIQATEKMNNVKLSINSQDQVIDDEVINLKLSEPFIKTVKLDQNIDREKIQVKLTDSSGKNLIEYNTVPVESPEPSAHHINDPMEQLTTDDLYLKGKSFYQDPFGPGAESYYKEMLKRNTNDYRANLEMGKIFYHRGEYEKSIDYLSKSLGQDPLNETAYESYLYLGLVKYEMGNISEASEDLGLASRYRMSKGLALYQLGNIALFMKNPKKAISFYKDAMRISGKKGEIWASIAIANRQLGMSSNAQTAISNALAEDPLEFTAITEQWINGNISDQEINEYFDRHDSTFVGSQLYIEEAIKYIKFGFWKDAANVLRLGIDHFSETGNVYPMLNYYLGYVYDQWGDAPQAKKYFEIASEQNSKYVFPYRKLSIKLFDEVLSYFPKDAKAWFYKGNVLTYRRRNVEGFEAWKKAYSSGFKNTVLLRNLAHAEWFINRDSLKTIDYLLEAQMIDPQDSRIFHDLDFMHHYCRMEKERIAQFENNKYLVVKNDPLVHRWVGLLLRLGNRYLGQNKIDEAYKNFERANNLMKQTYFFPREASEALQERYAETYYGLAEINLRKNNPKEALKNLKNSLEYSPNLNEGPKFYQARNRAFYLMGLAYEQLNNIDDSHKYFQMAIDEKCLPNSEAVYIQALSLKKLGKSNQAVKLLEEVMIELDNLFKQNKENQTPDNYYVLSLIYTELGFKEKAEEYSKIAFQKDADVILNSRLKARSIPWEGKF